MRNYLHPDLHMHSNVSDGTDSPEELLENVRRAGVDIFSLTDHDTFHGCDRIRANLREGDPVFVAGIELSCEDSFGKYHILGYGYDVNKASIRDAVAVTHNARREKARNRIRFLQDAYGFLFTEAEIKSVLQYENPGKPHFVALLMQKGYIKTKSEGFRILSGYRGEEQRLTPEQAIDAILQADGIPVLAHGILADGTKELTEEEITERVQRLKSYGLMGAECYYPRFTPEQREIMLRLAAQFNLMVTAGSDYHGSIKPVAIGQTGEVDRSRMARFYRAVHNLLEL